MSNQQIEKALKRIRANPADQYAKKRGFEVRDVTDAVRCATATNKVVRGFHEEKMKAGTYERKTLTERLAGPEEDLKAKAARAAADKETKKADRVIRYAEFGMACSSVPPAQRRDGGGPRAAPAGGARGLLRMQRVSVLGVCVRQVNVSIKWRWTRAPVAQDALVAWTSCRYFGARHR